MTSSRFSKITGLVLATFTFIAIASGPARADEKALARMRGVGFETSAVFPFGMASRVLEPSKAARLSAQWPVWADRVSVGLVGGFETQTGATDSVPHARVRTTMFAARVQSLLGPRAWGTLPYAALDLGMASVASTVTTMGGAETDDGTFVSQKELKSSTSGLLLAPEMGLWTTVSFGFSIKVSFRYQYVSTKENLVFGSVRTSALSGAGIGVGVYYRFE